MSTFDGTRESDVRTLDVAPLTLEGMTRDMRGADMILPSEICRHRRLHTMQTRRTEKVEGEEEDRLEVIRLAFTS